MASVQLQELTKDDLQSYVKNELKRVKPSSVNRELNVICAVLEAAVKEWKWVSKNISRDIVRPKNPPHRDRRISDDEIQRILDSLLYEETKVAQTQREAIAVAFLFAIETVCRQGEIFKLDWADVHLNESFLRLNDTKNGTSA